MSAEMDSEWDQITANDADIDTRSLYSLSDNNSDEDAASAYSNNVYSDGEEDTLLIITHQKIGIAPPLRARRGSSAQNSSPKSARPSPSKPQKMLPNINAITQDGPRDSKQVCHACQCRQDQPHHECMICSLPHDEQIAAHTSFLKKLYSCEQSRDLKANHASELQDLLAKSSKSEADAREEIRKLNVKFWALQDQNAATIKDLLQKKDDNATRLAEATSTNETIREEKVRVVQRNYLLQQELGATLQKLHKTEAQIYSLEQMRMADKATTLEMQKRLHATINELEQKVASSEQNAHISEFEAKYQELELARKADNEQALKAKDSLQSTIDELKQSLAATEQNLITVRAQTKEYKEALDAAKGDNHNREEGEILKNIKANAMKALEGLNIAEETMTALERRLFPQSITAAQASSAFGTRQLVFANEQRARLQSAVDAKDKAIADLEGKLKSSDERLTIYQNTTRNMGSYVTRARCDIEAKTVTINDLKKQVECCQSALNQAETRLIEKDDELTRYKTEISHLTNAHQACAIQQGDLQKQLAEKEDEKRRAVQHEQAFLEKEWERRSAYVEGIMDEIEAENDKLKQENHTLRHQVNRAQKKRAAEESQATVSNNESASCTESSNVGAQSTSVNGAFVRSNSSPAQTLAKVAQTTTAGLSILPKIVVGLTKLPRALKDGECQCLCACECHLHSDRSLYGCECPGCKCNNESCDGPSNAAKATRGMEKTQETTMNGEESATESKMEEVQAPSPERQIPGAWS